MEIFVDMFLGSLLKWKILWVIFKINYWYKCSVMKFTLIHCQQNCHLTRCFGYALKSSYSFGETCHARYFGGTEQKSWDQRMCLEKK